MTKNQQNVNSVIPGMGFHHIALKAADFEKSDAFYRALGMKFLLTWGEGEKKIAMYDLGDGGRLELFAGGGDAFPVSGKFIHFAFSVEDVDAAFETAVKAGGTPIKEPATVPLQSKPYLTAIRVAFVGGPDGEQLEFFKEVGV